MEKRISVYTWNYTLFWTFLTMFISCSEEFNKEAIDTVSFSIDPVQTSLNELYITLDVESFGDANEIVVGAILHTTKRLPEISTDGILSAETEITKKGEHTLRFLSLEWEKTFYCRGYIRVGKEYRYTNTFRLGQTAKVPKVHLLAPTEEVSVRIEEPEFKWTSLNRDTNMTYHLYLGEDVKELSVIAEVKDDSTYKSNVNLEFEKDYFWQIFAKDKRSNTFVSKSDLQIFSSEKVLPVTKPQQNVFTLVTTPFEWTKVSAFNQDIVYKVYLKLQSDDDYTLIGETRQTTLENNVLPMKINKKYVWRVDALTNGNFFGSSGEVFFRTLPELKTTFPVDNTTNQSTILTFRWQPVILSASNFVYEILIGTRINELKRLATTQKSTLSYILSVGELKANTKYYYKVRAINPSTNEVYSESNIITFETAKELITYPSTFKFTNDNQYDITFSWSRFIDPNKPNAFFHYNIKVFDSDLKLIEDIEGIVDTTFIYKDRQIKNNTDYFLRVEVHDENEQTLSLSNLSKFTTPKPNFFYITGDSDEVIEYLNVNHQNQLMVCGYFNQTLTPPGSNTMTSTGGLDPFLLYFDKDINMIENEQIVGSEDAQITSVTKGNEKMYITSTFSDRTVYKTVDFTSLEDGKDGMLIAQQQGFIDWSVGLNSSKDSKYNIISVLSGGLLGFTISDSELENFRDDISDASEFIGSVFSTGKFFNQMTFGDNDNKETFTFNNASTMFISLHTSQSGEYIWTLPIGGTQVESFAEGVSVVSYNGLATVIGNLKGSVLINNQKYESQGSESLLYVKVSTGKIVDTVNVFGGQAIAKVVDATIDDVGNVYVVGEFEKTISFGNTSTLSQGAKDIFIVKIDVNDNIVWLKSIGGNNNDTPSQVYVNNDKLYVVGEYREKSYFDFHTLTAKGSSDGFVARYNLDGRLEKIKSFGGVGRDRVSSIVEFDGDIWVGATFDRVITLDDVIYLGNDVDALLIRVNLD